jgi:hypothetical protein
MNKLLDVLLIIGFLVLDFLFFHDALKPGEVITSAQILAGVLSVIVIVRSVYSLLRR